MTNSLVVTGGEDRYLNVWQSSEQQVILQPAQSIWAVTILPNTDIVVGSRYVCFNQILVLPLELLYSLFNKLQCTLNYTKIIVNIIVIHLLHYNKKK